MSTQPVSHIIKLDLQIENPENDQQQEKFEEIFGNIYSSQKIYLSQLQQQIQMKSQNNQNNLDEDDSPIKKIENLLLQKYSDKISISNEFRQNFMRSYSGNKNTSTEKLNINIISNPEKDKCESPKSIKNEDLSYEQEEEIPEEQLPVISSNNETNYTSNPSMNKYSFKSNNMNSQNLVQSQQNQFQTQQEKVKNMAKNPAQQIENYNKIQNFNLALKKQSLQEINSQIIHSYRSNRKSITPKKVNEDNFVEKETTENFKAQSSQDLPEQKQYSLTKIINESKKQQFKPFFNLIKEKNQNEKNQKDKVSDRIGTLESKTQLPDDYEASQQQSQQSDSNIKEQNSNSKNINCNYKNKEISQNKKIKKEGINLKYLEPIKQESQQSELELNFIEYSNINNLKPKIENSEKQQKQNKSEKISNVQKKISSEQGTAQNKQQQQQQEQKQKGLKIQPNTVQIDLAQLSLKKENSNKNGINLSVPYSENFQNSNNIYNSNQNSNSNYSGNQNRRCASYTTKCFEDQLKQGKYNLGQNNIQNQQNQNQLLQQSQQVLQNDKLSIQQQYNLNQYHNNKNSNSFNYQIQNKRYSEDPNIQYVNKQADKNNIGLSLQQEQQGYLQNLKSNFMYTDKDLIEKQAKSFAFNSFAQSSQNQSFNNSNMNNSLQYQKQNQYQMNGYQNLSSYNLNKPIQNYGSKIINSPSNQQQIYDHKQYQQKYKQPTTANNSNNNSKLFSHDNINCERNKMYFQTYDQNYPQDSYDKKQQDLQLQQKYSQKQEQPYNNQQKNNENNMEKKRYSFQNYSAQQSKY
ncbi:hypothetical protein PPERSA_08799 [Pseudocohnilembus persalinus]|uniref:Uncharacterized protein n=1 Tax=Pseudocohnilembus persalinus TaxID=266149 RepID=A0A0V0R3L2_PSEPJ|nr:hypothetical protein PPERSA_08799 [Pseudocohnilembus persalinus]|eukprot:KRX09083.1 hypothetical protein PPERSA_08799 [Pseudocohnilembus persalinus]